MEKTGPTKKKLVNLQKEFGSDAEIAYVLGVSKRTVLSWRKKHGVPSIYFKNEKRNVQILRKKKAGWSIDRIARKFELSSSQVYRILRRGG